MSYIHFGSLDCSAGINIFGHEESLFLISRGRWGKVDTFLHFQPLLLYFKSKQAQNLSHNKATLYTQYHAKTWKQRPAEKILQSI